MKILALCDNFFSALRFSDPELKIKIAIKRSNITGFSPEVLVLVLVSPNFLHAEQFHHNI